MSLVTVSAKKGGREYHRHFDHEEAKRLRAEGWSYQRLSDHFGVSYTAIKRVLDPKVREKMNRAVRANLERKRRPCKGGCGRLVWQQAGRSGYCIACVAAVRSAVNVRDATLRCTACHEWKPDAEFPTSKGAKSRRGRDAECRLCSTQRRREHRQRRPDMQHDADQRRRQKRRKQKMARYIVFQPNGAGFVEVDRVDAGSPAHAVEQAAKAEGAYVAVPEGRFKLMRVAPVQALRVVQEPSAVGAAQ